MFIALWSINLRLKMSEAETPGTDDALGIEQTNTQANESKLEKEREFIKLKWIKALTKIWGDKNSPSHGEALYCTEGCSFHWESHRAALITSGRHAGNSGCTVYCLFGKGSRKESPGGDGKSAIPRIGNLSRNQKSPQGSKITSSIFLRDCFAQWTCHVSNFADRFAGAIQSGFASTASSKQS